ARLTLLEAPSGFESHRYLHLLLAGTEELEPLKPRVVSSSSSGEAPTFPAAHSPHSPTAPTLSRPFTTTIACSLAASRQKAPAQRRLHVPMQSTSATCWIFLTVSISALPTTEM